VEKNIEEMGTSRENFHISIVELLRVSDSLTFPLIIVCIFWWIH